MSGIGLRVQRAAASHEGRIRPHNEDSFACGDEDGLWVVADGMGGHEHGEWASAALIAALRGPSLPADFEAARNEVAERIHRANGDIFGEASARGVQIGTTVVALLVRGRRFAVLWVGDSRAYLLRDGLLHQLSSDHSHVQELVEQGLLRAADAEGHPMAHVLTRAVGVDATIEVDVVEDEVEPGDVFLLCSDGLHGYVERNELWRLLGGGDAERISADLIAATLDRGAPDNVTVIALLFTEPTMVPTGQPAEAP
ncbi:MAG TPA: protein phosphatase 2C domain-containing protein [Allosphingosinicella sp.]